LEKIIYAFWRRPNQDLQRIDEWLTGHVVPWLAQRSDVLGARVLVEASEYAIPAKANPDGQLCGLLSVWMSSYQDRAPVDETVRQGPVHAWHAWLVTESVPTAYGSDLTWPLGQRSPGLTRACLLDKPAGLDEARFLHLWHEVHRKTAATIHPNWSYVRNEVVRPLTPGAPRFRGIVYESTRSAEDTIDPNRFYRANGDAALLEANRRLALEESEAFIDMETMQYQLMWEYLVRVVST